MRISISGPPGSGKTTICMIVANRLDCNFVLVGQVFRQMASERQMDLAAFGKLAEEDETIDRELDERMVEVAKASDNIVLEGRLTGLLLKANNIPVLAVFVTASEQVRAERVAQREGRDAATVLKEMRTRERSEKKRYLAYYGVDPNDKSAYDLSVDSTSMPADKIADIILEKARIWNVENSSEDKKVDRPQ